MTDWIDDFMAQADKVIRQSGRLVLSILGEPGNPSEYPFSYSVGHAEKDHPELMLTSLGGDTATYLINTVADELEKRGWEWSEDDLIELEQVKIRLMLAENFDAKTPIATRRAEAKGAKSLRFLQILWPDPAGKFPDESEYDKENFPQPIWQHDQEKAKGGIN